MKESVTKFDLEAAFKALDELEIPVAKKGIAANRVNLKETFNRKLKTEALIEDYYDVNDTNDLEQASEDRQAEIAQAKLARIEKIVDLDAETEEDILPSYEGKIIVQCPQCMTLFYKNPEDVEASEDDDTIVNVGEVCQHCGNESGYTVIGKVAAVEPEAEETEEETADVDLNFEEPEDEESEEEPTEETDEETSEEETSEEEPAEDLDLEELPIDEEEPEEEKKEESLDSETKTVLTEAAESDAEVEEPDEEALKNKEETKFVTESLQDMDRFEMQQFLEDNLGTEETLAELVNAMSEDQMKDLFEFIAKNHDLDLEDDDEIEESLTEDADVSDAAFKELISSDEYKQPISVEEVSSYWTEGFDEASIEDSLDSVEDIEEEELDNVITESLKRVYENVNSFTIKECTLGNNKFIVNGTVKFNSGNTRQMSYIFNEAKISNKNTDKIILEGINKTLDPKGKFYLESMLTENKTKLVSNKLTYSYHINNNLIEKLK